MAAGFAVNAKDDDGNLFLYVAIKKGKDAFFSSDIRASKKIVKILVDNGADVDAKDANGDPVLYTSFGWSSDVVETLVDAGADVNAKTDAGDTLLYEAVRLGGDAFFSSDIARYKEIVQILVDAKADVNSKNRDGNPILYSTFGWSSDVVQTLVDAGADVNARTASGDTLLYEAVSLGGNAFFSSDKARYERIVKILVAAGANR